MGHNMAPVAGGIPDGKKDWFVFIFCPGKGLLTPGIPLYRVKGMLQQIGTLLIDQAV